MSEWPSFRARSVNHSAARWARCDDNEKKDMLIYVFKSLKGRSDWKEIDYDKFFEYKDWYPDLTDAHKRSLHMQMWQSCVGRGK